MTSLYYYRELTNLENILRVLKTNRFQLFKSLFIVTYNFREVSLVSGSSIYLLNTFICRYGCYQTIKS